VGNGKRHDLVEVLVIAVCAIFAEVQGFEDMAEWAQVKEAWLRRFLRLENGIPSHDTFNRIFRILDPKHFEQAFRRWVGGVVRAFGGQVSVDGKSLRGSAAGGLGPVHMVSAFATGLGIVLGQEKVADKSNEITAIPALLEALAIEGCLVSIDAMGTQREIARAIRGMGADYLLAVKGNQPTLYEALEGAFVGHWDEVHNAVQTGHGRHVFQIYRTLPNTGEVDTAVWVGCAMLGRVDSVRVVDGKASPVETRYYISSRTLSTADFAAAVRDHWGIESVPQAHGKEVQHELTDCVQATRKMRAGPSESAFRSGLQTTPSCCGQEPSVVSVGVKASRMYLEQVRIRETNESEPSMTRRYPETCRQNQGRLYLLGQACRTPDYWASGGRRIGGVKLIQASVWNCGNQSLRCQGRSPSGRNHEARVPMRSTGTDRSVRAMKAGNAAGAKGSGQAAAFGVQLAAGGDG
jgi:predicted transposase YbfD/YdcC